MLEEDLQSAVIEMATALGWASIHFRPARTDKGWRTLAQGSRPKGWPDLTLVHRRHRRLLFVELKTEKGRVSDDQARWLEDLLLCSGDNVQVAVWRPADWLSGEIERVLRCEVPVPAD